MWVQHTETNDRGEPNPSTIRLSGMEQPADFGDVPYLEVNDADGRVLVEQLDYVEEIDESDVPDDAFDTPDPEPEASTQPDADEDADATVTPEEAEADTDTGGFGYGEGGYGETPDEPANHTTDDTETTSGEHGDSEAAKYAGDTEDEDEAADADAEDEDVGVDHDADADVGIDADSDADVGVESDDEDAE